MYLSLDKYLENLTCPDLNMTRSDKSGMVFPHPFWKVYYINQEVEFHILFWLLFFFLANSADPRPNMFVNKLAIGL